MVVIAPFAICIGRPKKMRDSCGTVGDISAEGPDGLLACIFLIFVLSLRLLLSSSILFNLHTHHLRHLLLVSLRPGRPLC